MGSSLAEDSFITPERELLEYAERLGRQGFGGRIAVHLRFSALHAMYHRPDYIRMALGIFADQIAPYGGRYYLLSNQDLVYVSREASSEELDRIIGRVRLLFSEDPLITAAGQQQTFYTRYDLSTSYGDFLTLCRSLQDLAEAERQESVLLSQLIVRPESQPITVEGLARMLDRLTLLDVSSVVRRQPICVLGSGATPEIIYDELFISIADLRTLTGMQQDPTASRWLFQFLTQALDRHMLTHLTRDDITHPRPFSINLNIETVLSPEFQRFNDSIAPRLRHTLVVELNKIDVFADMGAYLFVRDFLHERGYRVCLDGLNHLTLPYLDRKQLGLDLIKIFWSPDSLADAQSEIIPQMRQLIKQADQSRFILCRCDTAAALAAGRELGIFMMQGREVDRMVGRK